MADGLIHNADHGKMPHVNDAGQGNSASQNTSVGSGSRPTKSTYPIDSGAAADPKTQGRENQKDPASLK